MTGIVVTDEAVVKVASGMFGPGWDHQPAEEQAVCLRMSRKVLEAAAPHLQVSAKPAVDDPEPSRRFSPGKWAEWLERQPRPVATRVRVAEVLVQCGRTEHMAAGMAEALLTAGVFREPVLPDRQTLALLLADTAQTLDKDEEWYIADRVIALLRSSGEGGK